MNGHLLCISCLALLFAEILMEYLAARCWFPLKRKTHLMSSFGALGFLVERPSHLGIGLLNKISKTQIETKEAS